jgi:hypothetical protein
MHLPLLHELGRHEICVTDDLPSSMQKYSITAYLFEAGQ